MIQKRYTLKYVINLIFFIGIFSQAQNTPDQVATDSLNFEKKYGLRLGLDLASLIRTGIDDDYTGFQVLGDYRITDDLYIAAEIGNENLNRSTERIDFETKGSFIKGGVDYNFYTNWLEMDNMIYAGARVGYANMSQRLTRFDYNDENNYFPTRSVFTDKEFDGLSSLWLELQVGIKVEVLSNMYLMANFQIKRLVTETRPDGFGNLFIPGYGRTYDNGNIGAGYSYGILYRIPLYKK